MKKQKNKGKKAPGIFSKIRYHFDLAMSKGMKSMIGILIAASIIFSLLFGVALGMSSGDISIPSAIWTSVMHIIDPGTITADSGQGIVYMVLMSVATLFGIAVTSTLIGVINTIIMLKLENLKKGKSKIVENDHIVILGFDQEVYTIINELVISNKDESKRKQSIVILDGSMTPEEMEDCVSKNVPDLHNTKIIFRKGNIYDVDAIEKCSVNTCRSVIVNVENDFVTIKCILAVASIIKDNDKVHITAVIKNKNYAEAAQIAGNNKVMLLNFEDIIAKIIAQSGRYTGVSRVFTELFNYEGSEFYTMPANEKLIGKTLEEANLYCTNAVLVGKEDASGKTMLYSSVVGDNRIIRKEDNLIFIAKSRSVNCTNEPYFAKNDVVHFKKIKSEIINNTLIFRYSKKIETILLEEYKFLNENSTITVAVKPEHVDKIKKIKNKHQLDRLVVEEFSFSREHLKSLIEKSQPESIIVLASASDNKNDYDISDERRMREMHKEDSEIILLLLQLRSLINENDKTFDYSITSEIQFSENQKLAKDTGVNDFVVGSILTNQILAQVSRQKSRLGIFQEIISAGNNDIIFKPAENFVDPGQTVKVFDIFKANKENKNYVFIGYKKFDKKAPNSGVFINPPKKSDYTCEENDLFIFIGNQESIDSQSSDA